MASNLIAMFHEFLDLNCYLWHVLLLHLLPRVHLQMQTTRPPKSGQCVPSSFAPSLAPSLQVPIVGYGMVTSSKFKHFAINDLFLVHDNPAILPLYSASSQQDSDSHTAPTIPWKKRAFGRLPFKQRFLFGIYSTTKT